MSGDHSDGEDRVGQEAAFVDTSMDMEVDLRLPLEVDMKPDQLREDVPAYPRAVDPSTLVRMSSVGLAQTRTALAYHYGTRSPVPKVTAHSI